MVIQTHQLTTIRLLPRPIFAWCDQCGVSVSMITPECAAEIIQTSTRAVYRRVERGELHFRETNAGTLLVCVNSLQQ